MRYFIGIDIGTSHTKSVILTETGEIMHEHKISYTTYQPSPGRVEQDPADLLRAVVQILKDSIESIQDKSASLSVAFSAAMHSLIAVDSDGHPITTLWTWADTRSDSIAKKIKATSLGRKLYRKTGTPIHPMSPLCKIAWMKEELPDLFAKSARFVSGKEYILYHLFGEWVVDYAIVSATGMFDIQKCKWSKVALETAGIREDQLSKAVLPTHQLPAIREHYRNEIGLNTELECFVGSSDGCLANLGSGAIRKGDAALTIGTSGAIRKLQSGITVDSRQRLFNYRMDERLFLSGGAINNGGNLLTWFVDVFTEGTKPFDERIAELLTQAADVAVGSEGLVFLPYIYGERAPIWDAAASGQYIGIRSHHTRAHFLRALLEGVAFSMLQLLEAMEENGERVDAIFATGGFIESPLWTRIISDVLNKKLYVSHQADASAIGAAFIALRAKGVIKDYKELSKWAKSDEVLTPFPANNKKYRAGYSAFTKLAKA